MKKSVLVAILAVVAGASAAQAEINVNVNVGVPGPRVIVPAPLPPPPPLPAPRVIVSGPPTVLFEVAPYFVAPSRLGFYVGVDTPYDIFFMSDYYYLYYGNSWHRSRYHNGPWVGVPYRDLPPGLRKHRIERIREYRDHEYRIYRSDRDHYRGRHFRAGEARREEWKDERRHDRQEWKEERRNDRQEWKEDRRQNREERREDRGGDRGDHGRHGRD